MISFPSIGTKNILTLGHDGHHHSMSFTDFFSEKASTNQKDELERVFCLPGY